MTGLYQIRILLVELNVDISRDVTAVANEHRAR